MPQSAQNGRSVFEIFKEFRKMVIAILGLNYKNERIQNVPILMYYTTS